MSRKINHTLIEKSEVNFNPQNQLKKDYAIVARTAVRFPVIDEDGKIKEYRIGKLEFS